MVMSVDQQQREPADRFSGGRVTVTLVLRSVGWFTRRRTIVVAATLFLFSAFLVALCLIVAERAGSDESFNKATFDKIQLGMTEQEVIAILGPANANQNLTRFKLVMFERGPGQETTGFGAWTDHKHLIEVFFDRQDRVVYRKFSKAFAAPTGWSPLKMLRQWLNAS
jgi:hypothetical protein